MSTRAVEIRPASEADIRGFFEGKVPHTMKAWVAVRDGKAIGIGGFVFSAGRVVGFVDLDVDAREFPVSFHRIARQALRDARRDHRYVFSEEGKTEVSRRWLRRLGFAEFDKDGTVLCLI